MNLGDPHRLLFFSLLLLLCGRHGVLCLAAVTYTVTYPSVFGGSVGQVEVFVSSAYDANVEVDGNSTAVMSHGFHAVSASVQSCNDVINVTADDVFIAVTTKGHHSGLNNDAFRPLPRGSLGNEYTVSAWNSSLGVLSATDTGANITVEIPRTFTQEVSWMGVTYGNGTQFVVSLEANQLIQLNFTDVDPTGLHLLTPDGAVFGVLSGAMETAVNGSLPGNLYDVIPPHQLLGNFYVGVPLPGQDELIWRLVNTGSSSTVMFVLGQGGAGDLWVSLQTGEHTDYVTNASNPVLIYSPQPALVSLLVPSGDTHPPAMAVMCPMSRWNSYHLLYPLDPSGSRQEYVTITIPTSSSSGVRMTSSGGVTSQVTGWTTFDSAIFLLDYVSLPLSGVTSLWHVGGERLQVVQSSFARDWGYAFSSPCDLGYGSPTTTTTTTTPLSTLSSTITTTAMPSTTTATTPTTTTIPSTTTTIAPSTTTVLPTTTTVLPTTTTVPSPSASSSPAVTSPTVTSTSPSTTSSTTATTSTVSTVSSTTATANLLTSSAPTSSATTTVVAASNSTARAPSPSPSLSFLPSWLVEQNEWVVAGAAAGGALVVAVAVAAVVIAVRKYKLRSVTGVRLTGHTTGTAGTTGHAASPPVSSQPVTTTPLGGQGQGEGRGRAGEGWGGGQRKVSTSSTRRLRFKPRLLRAFSRSQMSYGVTMPPVDTV